MDILSTLLWILVGLAAVEFINNCQRANREARRERDRISGDY